MESLSRERYALMVALNAACKGMVDQALHSAWSTRDPELTEALQARLQDDARREDLWHTSAATAARLPWKDDADGQVFENAVATYLFDLYVPYIIGDRSIDQSIIPQTIIERVRGAHDLADLFDLCMDMFPRALAHPSQQVGGTSWDDLPAGTRAEIYGRSAEMAQRERHGVMLQSLADRMAGETVVVIGVRSMFNVLHDINRLRDARAIIMRFRPFYAMGPEPRDARAQRFAHVVLAETCDTVCTALLKEQMLVDWDSNYDPWPEMWRGNPMSEYEWRTPSDNVKKAAAVRMARTYVQRKLAQPPRVNADVPIQEIRDAVYKCESLRDLFVLHALLADIDAEREDIVPTFTNAEP